MIKKLSTSAPYNSLCKDLYSLGIFDKAINGLLSIIETDDKHQTILIERRFADNSGDYIEAGYYFIQCLNITCEEEHLKQSREILEIVIKQKVKSNYMEVDPILLAPEFNKAVLDFVNQYNKIQRRKPIQLFRYGE